MKLLSLCFRQAVDQRVGDLVVREHEVPALPIASRAHETRGHRLGEREPYRGLAPRAGADEEPPPAFRAGEGGSRTAASLPAPAPTRSRTSNSRPAIAAVDNTACVLAEKRS